MHGGECVLTSAVDAPWSHPSAWGLVVCSERCWYRWEYPAAAGVHGTDAVELVPPPEWRDMALHEATRSDTFVDVEVGTVLNSPSS